MLNERVREILLRVASKWDHTEGLVKEAENLTGDAVGATMFELRYAGRKLVDAVREACSPSGCIETITKYCLEVEENCDRAHHDAIDAIIYYLRQSVKLSEETFGPDLLLENWPNYIHAKAMLDRAGIIVVQSRRDRSYRVDLYEKLRREEIPQILNFIAELTQSENALKLIAARRRQEDETKENEALNRVSEAENRADEAERSKQSLDATVRNLKVAIWALVATIFFGVIGVLSPFFTANSDNQNQKPNQVQQAPPAPLKSPPE